RAARRAGDRPKPLAGRKAPDRSERRAAATPANHALDRVSSPPWDDETTRGVRAGRLRFAAPRKGRPPVALPPRALTTALRNGTRSARGADEHGRKQHDAA